MIKWWRKKLGSDRKVEEAEHVRRDAQRRLGEARKRWPEVDRARSTLESLVEQALRGGA